MDPCARANRERGRKLGCGEQGCTYEDNLRENRVIKETKFGDMKQSQWAHEAEIGRQLGQLGVGPKIYHSYVCGTSGYIEMQRLVTADRYDSITIREKRKDETVVDHTDRLPETIQRG